MRPVYPRDENAETDLVRQREDKKIAKEEEGKCSKRVPEEGDRVSRFVRWRRPTPMLNSSSCLLAD